MYMDSGATRSILCNSDGIPCLLKTLSPTIGGKQYQQIGVRLHDFFCLSASSTTDWESMWFFEGTRSVVNFFGSTGRVVTTDLHVYEPATGDSFDLLENESSWQRPQQRPSNCWLDLSRRYLCLQYLSTVTVVIDVHSRKVAAQYVTKYHRGCLIGDAYWVCVDDKLVRKPFPAFEEAPPEKAVFGMDWYYATRPELW